MDTPGLEYSRARWRFAREVRERSFDEALLSLREGLRLAPAAVKESHRNYGGTQTVPFIEQSAGAVAALFDDVESFDLMDVVFKMRFVAHTADIGQYRRDAVVMERVREIISATPSLSLPALKRHFTLAEASRLSRLLAWLSKRDEITLVKRGSVMFVTLGVPERTLTEHLTTFRRNRTPISTTRIPISHLAIPAEFDSMERLSPTNSWRDFEDLQPDFSSSYRLIERPVIMPRRQPSIMQAHSTVHGTWLIAKSKEQPDRSYSTFVSRYSLDGERLPTLRLPHAVTRIASNFSSSHIITSDAELNVRIYDFDGASVFTTSLWESPEVLAMFDEAPRGVAPSSLRQQVDVHIIAGRIAFSVADRFWVFTLEGEHVFAGRLPAIPDGFFHVLTAREPDVSSALTARGLPRDLTRRRMASWLDEQDFMPVNFMPALGFSLATSSGAGGDGATDNVADAFSEAYGLQLLIDEVGGLKRDRISILQFTDDGFGIWVGTESCLVLRLRWDGSVDGIWSFEKPAMRVFELGGCAFAILPHRIVQLEAGKVPLNVGSAAGRDILIHSRFVARRDKNEVVVANVLEGIATGVQLRRDFRGMIPTTNGIRVEMDSVFVEIAI
jgi:hypothetical protein